MHREGWTSRDGLCALIDRHEAEHLFSGAVLVMRGEEELLACARGLAHRGFAVPNAVDTRFDTASLGKLFTAAAAFRLVDRGLLDLDEPVRAIADLAGTAIPEDVTLRHCLTHCSGISDDADEEAGEDYEALWRTTPVYGIRETRDFLAQFAHKAPRFPAGTQSRYNNCAYVLVGLALEARSGMPFRELVRREVLEPAGLADTGYFAKDSVSPRIAEGYATVRDAEDRPAGFRKNLFSFPPIGSPDAGILTTVRDLHRFFRALEGGPLLSPACRRQFLEPQVDAFTLRSGDVRRYGFGLEHDLAPDGRCRRYGKDGVNPGVAAIAMRYPGSGGFIAILANQDADVWGLCRGLAELAGFSA